MEGSQQAAEALSAISNCLKWLIGFGGAVCVGFDWPAVEAVLRLRSIKLHPFTIERLQQLEPYIVEQANKKGNQ